MDGLLLLLFDLRNRTSPEYERPPSAKIFHNFNHAKPYTYTGSRSPPNRAPAGGRVVVMSGVSANSIPSTLYMHLHKQYYARRHGYKFLLQLSDEFVPYWPKSLWVVRATVHYSTSFPLHSTLYC